VYIYICIFNIYIYIFINKYTYILTIYIFKHTCIYISTHTNEHPREYVSLYLYIYLSIHFFLFLARRDGSVVPGCNETGVYVSYGGVHTHEIRSVCLHTHVHIKCRWATHAIFASMRARQASARALRAVTISSMSCASTPVRICSSRLSSASRMAAHVAMPALACASWAPASHSRKAHTSGDCDSKLSSRISVRNCASWWLRLCDQRAGAGKGQGRFGPIAPRRLNVSQQRMRNRS